MRNKYTVPDFPKRILSALLLLTLAVPAWGQAADSGDTSGIKKLNLDGYWKLTELEEAGIYSGGAEEQAKNLIGKKILIQNTDVTLPDGKKCQILSSYQKKLEDGWPSFGSGGGSWKQIGLTQAPDFTYNVVEVRFDCDEMFWGIIIQPKQGLHLLKVWEVYLVMEKVH